MSHPVVDGAGVTAVVVVGPGGVAGVVAVDDQPGQDAAVLPVCVLKSTSVKVPRGTAMVSPTASGKLQLVW